MTKEVLEKKLADSAHNKAGGPDNCNFYLLSMCSPSVKEWLLEVVNLHLTTPMPESWQRSNVFLLYKKGAPDIPSNYRPISLLNVVYKLIASHLTGTLSSLTAQHGLNHPAQIGGLHNRRTSDHICHLSALMGLGVEESPQSAACGCVAPTSCNCPPSPPLPPPGGHFYHLYVDFNKAFNSVPRAALREALVRYGLPSWLVSAVFLLYTDPNEYPIVNGHTPSSYRLDRGLRQGCPMSPILFNLYLNLVLFSLPRFRGTTFAFIDDILFRVADPLVVAEIFSFFDTFVRDLGLDMNAEKTEVQAMGPAPHFSFRAPGGAIVSTCKPGPDGAPRDFYKYLGVYVYSSNPGARLDEYILNEIGGFFSALAPLELTHSELVLLMNCQLIPILTYRLMAHSFPPEVLDFYDRALWAELCANSRVSEAVSEKDRGVRRKEGGLNLNSLQVSVQKTTYHTCLRHLNGEGPPRATQVINKCLLAPDQNPLLDVFLDSAQSLGVRTHGWGPWNPCRVRDLIAG